MPSSMKPCKRYRMRPDGDRRFVEGYFLDDCFYNAQGISIGNVEMDGFFRYRPVNHAGKLLKYFYDFAGTIEGLRLVVREGTGFDLVEMAEEG